MTLPLVQKSLFPALRACSRCGVTPTRYLLAVQIARQTTALFQREKGSYELRKIFRCSTSKYGIGETAGSNMTPRGLHRIARKIGDGWPVGVVFEGRQVVGFTWQGKPSARIAHRILWLEGLEPGLNRGGNVDSFERYIYIHGTGNEMTLGRPDSHGCVHLSANDLLPLYDKLPVGTLVWMST
ncbi:MAG TPA: L,D-transpeptidase [Verrucomicrobiae bacterium]|jgi:lipoprotein-anchoring transpeptidase ErfK/SrfK|nr:L,D-transpeptidase [Verrucomicrobiae bacterium]